MQRASRKGKALGSRGVYMKHKTLPETCISAHIHYFHAHHTGPVDVHKMLREIDLFIYSFFTQNEPLSGTPTQSHRKPLCSTLSKFIHKHGVCAHLSNVQASVFEMQSGPVVTVAQRYSGPKTLHFDRIRVQARVCREEEKFI